jgi:hypothetical protein
VFSWVFYGVGHTFSLSFSEETSISSLRFGISERKETKLIKHLFIFITPLLTAIVASGIQKESKLKNLILIFSILVIASWGGSKGPILSVCIVYVISKLTFKEKRIKINFKNLALIIIFISLLMGFVYRIVLFQYAHMEGKFSIFLDYFYQRVFVAQIIGVYEQFNLFLQNPRYFYHGVPFASSFLDFPVFHKDLMLISEDRSDAASIGIKNTLFIAEAYGMGGSLLLLLSPFWMAFSFAINYKWMVFFTNKYIFKNFEYTKKVMGISIFSYVSIAGGFSDLMFFKITILMTILILPFTILNWIFNLKRKNHVL